MQCPLEASLELARLLKPDASVVVGINSVTQSMDDARFVVVCDDPKHRHVVAHIFEMAERLRIPVVVLADSAPLSRALGIKRINALAVLKQSPFLEDVSAWVHRYS